MTDPSSHVARTCRRRPLSACMASVFALSAPGVAIADIWTVTSCDEGSSGDTLARSGTLRYALLNAVSPALIDMTGLAGLNACPNSKISLTTGSLATTLNDVTILGPDLFAGMTIDASTLFPLSNGPYRVLQHDGTGTLTLKNVGVKGGHVFKAFEGAAGGCVRSYGSVALDYASVTNCSLETSGYDGAGGGVYARGTVTAFGSLISGNTVSVPSANARGGGIYAKSDISVAYSSMSSNSVASVSGTACGGGIYTKRDASLWRSLATENLAHSSNTALGGTLCAGSASLLRSNVLFNRATSNNYAYGGMAFVPGLLELRFSYVSHNYTQGFMSRGGAAQAGSLLIDYSTLDQNEAKGQSGVGGALVTAGRVVIRNSTISNNHAKSFAGGLNSYGGDAANKSVTITDSTVSGNTSDGLVGGVYTNAAKVLVGNSTIAFNSATNGMALTEYLAPGMTVRAQPSSDITLLSSIFSNNSTSSTVDDFSVTNANPFVGGGDNLVFAAHAALPVDTLVATCPLLGPLRFNGGWTNTHALNSNSPAIDGGNSDVVATGDQRGSAFPRVSGSQADIGAYELQKDEIILNAGFDGCTSP